MDYKKALLDLVAYCQREGILSATELVVTELSDILEWNESDIEELLDS